MPELSPEQFQAVRRGSRAINLMREEVRWMVDLIIRALKASPLLSIADASLIVVDLKSVDGSDQGNFRLELGADHVWEVHVQVTGIDHLLYRSNHTDLPQGMVMTVARNVPHILGAMAERFPQLQHDLDFFETIAACAPPEYLRV